MTERVVGLLAIIVLLSGCNSAQEACVERGVAYFAEIGSYPTLNSEPNKGRRAEDVARERCRRTTTAF